MRASQHLTGLGVVNGIDLDEHAGIIVRQAGVVAARHSSLSAEELYTPGWFGLRHAAEKFDAARSVKFGTFAVLRVRGAMLDYLRELDLVPRLERQREKRGEVVVAKALQVSAMSEAEQLRAEPSARDPEPDESRALAAKIFRKLHGQERWIVEQYYLEERTNREIGEALGVTESRVCQVLANIRRRLGWRVGFKGGKGPRAQREPLVYIPQPKPSRAATRELSNHQLGALRRWARVRAGGAPKAEQPKPKLLSERERSEAHRLGALRRWARVRERLGLQPGEKIPASQEIGRRAARLRWGKIRRPALAG